MKIENKNVETLNALVNNLYDVQKTRIGMSNRNQALQEKDREEIFDEYVVRLKKLEKDIVKDMQGLITQFSISTWMLGQRGIGPSLTGQTISMIRDIGRFDNISKLWAYSGMATMYICTECNKRWLEDNKKGEWINRVAKRLEEQHNKKKTRYIDESGSSSKLTEIEAANVSDNDIEDTNFTLKARKMLCSCEHPITKVIAQRKIKNTMIDYNPKMKKLCRNIALSLIQYNQFYGDMYEGFLQMYIERKDFLKELDKGKFTDTALENIKHSRAVKMARRKMVKIFLSHLWMQWRKIDGLPITKPYIFDIKGHSNYIEPPEGKYPELTDMSLGDADSDES